MDDTILVEVVFMMVILKIPVVYLCAVVWWAIKAEPRPLEGAAARAGPAEPEPCPWGRRRAHRRPPRPSGRSGRRVAARRARVGA